MIHTDWLGYYWNGIDDPWDDPMRRLHLFVTSSNVFCVEYYSEFRYNHGYSIEFLEGSLDYVIGGKSVGSVVDLMIDVTYRYATSWNDHPKEHRIEKYVGSEPRSIRIKSIDEGNKPILSYNDKDMSFKCADSVEDSSLFAWVRAKYCLPDHAGLNGE
jgi:hypothetical protein